MYSQAVSYPPPENYDPAAAVASAPSVAAPAYPPYGAPQYAAAPPPAQHYGYGPPQGYGGGYGQQYGQPDELRTIFITGFPGDMRERELNNLLRFLPGYEASQLHQPGLKSPQAQGFALFDTAASAQNSLRHVANLVFEEGSTLRCELARKNMYIKDGESNSMTKRSRYDSGGYGGAGRVSYGAVPVNAARTASANARDNAPCSTLFVGNLGDGANEQELQTLFGSVAGFRQMKLNHGARGITCFVEYEDVLTAMEAHKNLQGSSLQSSDRGPIRIQYSRNPFFGKKRERDGTQLENSAIAYAAHTSTDAGGDAAAAAAAAAAATAGLLATGPADGSDVTSGTQQQQA